MTRIEAEIAAKDRWIERAQLEKDRLLRRLARPGVREIERGFIAGRLEFLDKDIEQVRETKASLEALRFRPECTWPVRPRMARVPFTRTAERRRA